jgi:hypothetical protein
MNCSGYILPMKAEAARKKTEATTHALKRDHVKRRSTGGMEVTQAWLDHTLFLSECLLI